jgi:putative flippase GtrA
MDLGTHAHTFLRSRFLRIFIIGGIGVLLQTLVFEALGVYLGIVSLSTAAVAGGELGVLANFSLNERFSFPDRIAHTDSLLPRLMRFHMIVAGSLFIQWALLFFAEHHTQNILLLHAAYLGGIVLGFISNYIGYHLFVWRSTAPM